MATIIAEGYRAPIAKRTQSLAFVIGASSGGTLIEWYDFFLYGVLATFFAAHFFPGAYGTHSLRRTKAALIYKAHRGI